jgi:hypothetical protein
MSKNSKMDKAIQFACPVPEGTVSGDPVAIGAGTRKMVGYALTDRGADTVGEATCKFNGSAEFEVAGIEKEAKEKAIAFGDEIFIDNEGNLDADNTGTFFGWALGVVAKGKTEVVEVKIATP